MAIANEHFSRKKKLNHNNKTANISTYSANMIENLTTQSHWIVFKYHTASCYGNWFFADMFFSLYIDEIQMKE